MPRPLAGALLALALFLGVAAGPLPAAGQPLVKVVVEFREQATGRREGVQGGGAVIVQPGPGRVRGRGGLAVEDTTTRTTRSTGLFIVAVDGGVGTIMVAEEVPHPHVAVFYDHALGWGYVQTGIEWQRVGAGLAIRPTVLPGRQVRIRVAPWLSYFTPGGGGTVELTQAATELVVRSGQRVALGGASTELHALTRRILGYRAESQSGEQAIFLTATVQ